MSTLSQVPIDQKPNCATDVFTVQGEGWRNIPRDIGPWTTPGQFDEMCRRCPAYRLTDCGWGPLGGTTCTALHAAAINENISLIEHIFEIGRRQGLELINLRDPFGRTPLFEAASRGQYESIKKLLKLGASVNIAISGRVAWSRSDFWAFESIQEMGVPKGATPLWIVLHMRLSSKIAALLLSYGAVAMPQITDPNAIKNLREAEKIAGVRLRKQVALAERISQERGLPISVARMLASASRK